MWPDNVDAVRVFDRMGTQWRVGPAGPVGLDYNVLPFVLRQCGVPRRQWPRLFEDLRVMEGAALDEINGS